MEFSTDTLVFLGGVLILIMKITAFVIGYKVIKIGADLLRDGITGEFKFESSFSGLRADLFSASPGLLFLVIGGFLIGFALFVDKPVDFGGSSVVISGESDVTQDMNVDSPPEVELPNLGEGAKE